MRKRSIKFISILLLLLMSVLCFVACSSDDQGDGLENYKQNAITEITSVRAEYMDSLYSLENIEALNLILEDAKSKISAATEKSQIDIIVSQAKNNFSKINTMKQEEENREDANKKELAIYKRQRQTELDEYRAMLDDSKYSSVNVKELNEIVSIAKNDIFYSETFEEVLKIYNDAVIAIFAVPTIDQEIELLLQAAREEAISALKNYRENKDDDNYSTENCANMDRIVESTISQIEAAITIEDIENLLQHAFELLDAVEPFGQSELEKTKIKEIEALNIYHFGFDYNLYTVSGQAELDGILEDAIKRIQEADSEEDIVEIVGSAKTAFHEVKTYAELFAEYKPKAEEKLRQYRASKLDEAYSAEGVNSLNLILRNALSAISNATTFEAVDNIVKEAVAALDDVNVLETELIKIKNSKIAALNQAISTIDAIKSIFDLLSESKANALVELRAYRETKKDSDYSNHGISLLNDALRDGEIAIDRAVSIEEVESALQAAKNALDLVLTESEENNFDIWELRAKALEELEAFRIELGEDNYGPNGKAQLEDILMNAMAEVSEASTPSELEQVVQATKEKMKGVLTFKSEYQNEIYSYRNSFVDTDYTSDGLSALDAATQKYASLIMDCLNIDSAKQVYFEAIQTMDNVLQKDGNNRFKIKQSAIDEITLYRENKSRAEYDDNGNEMLDKLLADTVHNIEKSIGSEQINELIMNAKKRMDDVLTNAQNQALTWADQYRDIFDDNEYSDENIDILDSLIDEFKDNILNHISLQDAKIKVAREMDSVATISGSCRQTVKDVYIDDLRKYKETFVLSNYSSNAIAVLESLFLKGTSEIQLSYDLDSSLFETAVSKAKVAMDAVLTLKDEAVAELEAYRATFDESEYSAESIAELDKILSDFINAAIEPSQIQIALGEAKAAMDAVLTLKDEAVAELEAYRATFDESEYSAESIAELDKILSDFINAAIEPSQIQIALGEAKATMDAVLSE